MGGAGGYHGSVARGNIDMSTISGLEDGLCDISPTAAVLWQCWKSVDFHVDSAFRCGPDGRSL